jgi:hypothetical protein
MTVAQLCLPCIPQTQLLKTRRPAVVKRRPRLRRRQALQEESKRQESKRVSIRIVQDHAGTAIHVHSIV